MSSDDKIDMPSQAHSDLFKTSHKRRSIKRLGKHVTLVVCGRAVRNGAVQRRLSVNFSSENIFLHFWKEGLVHGANASPLHTG
eukprot:15709168-Heterocapsa_arctica.AAC.1